MFRHDNCEQKKHILLCKMSPASHFFLFEKGEKNYMKSVHSCREETLWQTFCPTSRSRRIFKNSESCQHKFLRFHAIACDRMQSHEIANLMSTTVRVHLRRPPVCSFSPNGDTHSQQRLRRHQLGGSLAAATAAWRQQRR